MKNASSFKSQNVIESPKTPGGISKSLLTPCRRLGLSRKWKKNGPSPFVSPLANSNINVIELKQEAESRKRKKITPEKEPGNAKIALEIEDDLDSTSSNTILQTSDDSSNTPKRSNLQRKKSKTLVMASDNFENIKQSGETSVVPENDTSHPTDSLKLCIKKNDKATLKVSKVLSKTKIKINSSLENLSDKETELENSKFDKGFEQPKMPLNDNPVQTSPNNLTKECIVVIQNKLLKPTLNKSKSDNDKNINSQALIDSDSDDIPLCQINKTNNMNEQETVLKNENASNATEEIIIANKLGCKKSSENLSKVKSKTKLSRNKPNKPMESKPPSQSSNTFDDDDDFDFNPKKTIIIKKTYNKVVKPLKAKSTGSITDRDIEEIKARIEMKKRILLTRSINPETEDVRGLIKKWQRGCQDALMELLELMKKRIPDQNLDNSEILQMLKIPLDLVGYDADNDCFTTPDDEQIILSSLNIV